MEILNHGNGIQPSEKSFRKRLSILCQDLTDQEMDEAIQSLINNGTTQFYPKSGRAATENLDTGKYIYFVHTGIAHSFVNAPHRKKLVVNTIWTKDDIIFNLNTFLHGTIPIEHTQMLEEGQLIAISYASLKVIINELPQLMSLLLHLQAERQLACQHFISLIHLSVIEKVRYFVRRHPTLVTRINQEIIAAHLGMSRTTLSKALTLYKSTNNGTTTSASRQQ
jgi:CRP-like cAMP-binding protein